MKPIGYTCCMRFLIGLQCHLKLASGPIGSALLCIHTQFNSYKGETQIPLCISKQCFPTVNRHFADSYSATHRWTQGCRDTISTWLTQRCHIMMPVISVWGHQLLLKQHFPITHHQTAMTRCSMPPKTLKHYCVGDTLSSAEGWLSWLLFLELITLPNPSDLGETWFPVVPAAGGVLFIARPSKCNNPGPGREGSLMDEL